MILRLVKRDPAWQMALMMTVVVVIAVTVLFGFSKINTIVAVAATLLGYSLQARPHVHATLFEAALPIAGRDLFLARTLSLLAMVWLPVLCGAAAILLVRADGPLALMLVEAAAILTPVILLQQAVRVREIAGPQWPLFVAWALAGAVCGLRLYVLSRGVVLSICGLVSAALLIRTWFAVPPSLQVVSLKVAEPIAVPASPVARRASAWMPILRSAPPGCFALCMVLMAPFGTWFTFFPMFTVFAAVQSRQRTRWLSALPLSHRALLTITLVSSVVPLLAGVAVGMYIGAFLIDRCVVAGPNQPPIRILTLEAAALCALFLVFATELPRWHRLRRLSTMVRAILMSMFFGVPIAAYGVAMYHWKVSQALFQSILLRLTSALPNPLLAVSAAAVPVGAMYWLLERQFRQSELTMWKRPGQPE